MDLLIQAFRAHAPQHAVLAILGEGKERKTLERLAGGDARIRLLGFRSDVDAALRSVDLFVSASREEAFPLAILEAMRAGLPVIASATQGPLEMLGGQPATLVPIGDVAALGTALRTVLAERCTQPRALRQPVAYDLQQYERSQAVQRVLNFYDQVQSRAVGAAARRTFVRRAPTHA
jgi:glycosyltransferase involved in cell wall biosynthesis